MPAVLDAPDEVALLKEQLAQKEAVIEQQENELDQLKKQIAWLKKQLFGSKSEQKDQKQLELVLQGLEQQLARIEQPRQKVEYERAAPAKGQKETPSREERYSHLPVASTVIIEPEEVKKNPDAYEHIGDEETFEIDVIPPQYVRNRIIRPKYRKKDDREVPPVVAPAPRRIVEGLASPGLLVHLILSKYCDHIPLFRFAKMAKREGVEFSRQSLMRWVEVVSDWLKPIYAYMGRELHEGGYIQADETPIKYLDPDESSGKARQGYLCAFSRPQGNVVFTWSTSRSEEAIAAFLSGYKGILQTDGYAGWKSYAGRNPEVTMSGCMAHMRRKFVESLDESPRYAAYILKQIGYLYAYEKAWKQAGLSPKLVGVMRQSHSRMIIERLHRVIQIVSRKCLPSTHIGQACGYALNQWPELITFLEHGQVAIDNNLVENAIRPSAIGKKNWLFVGHPDAGERPAIIYSLLISCERFGHNPREYLKDVLHRLTLEPDRFKPRNIAALTPRNWKPAGMM